MVWRGARTPGGTGKPRGSYSPTIGGRLGAALIALALVPTGAIGQVEPAPIEAGVAPAPGTYAPGIDVLHYEVEIGVGPVDVFEAEVTVTVRAEADAPTLPLDFTGLYVSSLSIDGRTAPFEQADGRLLVPLRGVTAGQSVDVHIAYGGTPDDALALQENVHGDRGAFVDNWPNRTRFWLPSVDHPADKATVAYTIHAPSNWKVIANGHLEGVPYTTPATALGPKGQRMTWRWEVGVPISTYNMVFGAADMEIRVVGHAACGSAPASRREDGCVEVTYWAFPQDVDKAETSFARAAEMVDYFTETVGPYPFEKLANVQSSTRFGGMENASAIFYSERAIAAGRNIEGTVSHEIAHQWFGDAVTESDWHHLWLSEGFATYFGALFFEHADGVESFRERMEQSRQRILASDDTDRPIVDMEEQSLFALLNDNNYPKGGWVLHMLRGLLGDEIFFAGVREYYGRHLHAAVLTEDFQAVMEETSGQDLEWFFDQWIYQPGYPVLDVTQQWNDAEGVLEVRVEQVQKSTWPRFQMPVVLHASRGGDYWGRRVELDGTSNVFRLNTGGPVDSVVVDPDGWLLKGGR